MFENETYPTNEQLKRNDDDDDDNLMKLFVRRVRFQEIKTRLILAQREQAKCRVVTRHSDATFSTVRLSHETFVQRTKICIQPWFVAPYRLVRIARQRYLKFLPVRVRGVR